MYIGNDPGVLNYGQGVLDDKFRVIGSLIVPNTIQTLVRTEYPNQRKLYYRHCVKILDHFQPSCVTSERYQTRGFKTAQGEMIAVMNAIMAEACARRKIPFIYIIASQWKNAVSRLGIDLKVEYNKLKSKKFPAHRLDSLLIAAYGAQENSFLSKKQVEKIIKRCYRDLGELV